jgi:glycosyltransferase involved in cell wall biosynthesis
LKVLHLQSGELSGGAARGTYWLHKALRQIGVDSHLMISGRNDASDPSVSALATSGVKRVDFALRNRIGNLPVQFYRGRQRLIYNTGFAGLRYQKTDEYRQADIIHLHWINGFVSMRSLRHIKKPIVWTLRDMWPLTGGCHVAMECERYTSGCGLCPQLGSRRKWDLSKIVSSNKVASIPREMRVVGISKWLSQCAKDSTVFDGFNIRTISNNIDTDDFFPVPKEAARLALGLDKEVPIVLVGAHSLNDPWKAFDQFVNAVNALPNGSIHIVLFGRVTSDALAMFHHPVTSLSFLADTVSLRLAYSAADLFVAPSRMDAFGKTLAESMACGTPVVCFDATGPADIVEHQVTGYKAQPFDSSDLACGIEWVLSRENLESQKIRHASRERAVRLFDSRVIAKQYVQLYTEMLG